MTLPTSPAAKRWDGWGTTLKPAWEPIILAMKPRDGSFERNALKHGVAGLNIDGARIPASPGRGVWDSSNATCHEGRKFNNSSSRASYTDTRAWKGRWPANLLLSHHPACMLIGQRRIKGSGTSKTFHKAYPGTSITTFVRGVSHPGNQHADADGLEAVDAWDCHPDCPIQMLDQQSGTRKAGGWISGNEPSHRSRNCYGKMDGRRMWSSYGDTGGASRFFYCAKASKNERSEGLSPSVMNDHPTVKPLKLLEYLCKLTATPTGGTILDPFAGSGTTLLAATNVGRKCIGIEINPDYVPIACQRFEDCQVKQCA